MTDKLKIRYALCLFKFLFESKDDTKRTFKAMRLAMDRLGKSTKQAFVMSAEPMFQFIEHENVCHFSNKEKEEVMDYLYGQIGGSLEKAMEGRK